MSTIQCSAWYQRGILVPNRAEGRSSYRRGCQPAQSHRLLL